MMHRAWSSIVEVPYCFSRSSVKFQDHTALKIVEFDPNWAFPDCNSSLNSPMAMKCCRKLETAKERCPIVFQGHPSNFKVTRDKTSPILTQIGRFWTIGRSQLSNPSDLPCWLCSHHRIIMKFSGVITSDRSDVHAKGQGQRSEVKVTEVVTPFNRFRTVTPVWIHILRWNVAYSLMLLRRGALLFLRSSVKFQGHTAKKIVEFDPDWAFPDCNSSSGLGSSTFGSTWVKYKYFANTSTSTHSTWMASSTSSTF